MKEEIRIFDHKMKHFRKIFSVLRNRNMLRFYLLIGKKEVYRSNCRIKSSEMPMFIGDSVNQGAWSNF